MAKNAGQFADEIKQYLIDKIPNVSLGTVLEITEYITCKMIVFNNDMLRERDREWKHQMCKPKGGTK